MNRQQINQLLGGVGLTLLLVGAGLYTINSPERTLTWAMLAVGAALLLAYAAINHRTIAEFSKKRSARYGANLAVVIVLYATIAVIVQALATRHSLRVDITENKRYSLAGQTVNVLTALTEDIQLYGFYAIGSEERVGAEDLFKQYAHVSGHVRFEMIDPDRNPSSADALGVDTYDTVVVEHRDRRERLSRLTEESLTNAILRVTRTEPRNVCFVVGHAEKDLKSSDPGGASIMRQALENQNYTVRTVSLFEEEAVPDDCDVLLIAGPQKDYFDSETAKIGDYLDTGGNAAFLIDAQVDVPNIEALLARYNVGINNDVIIDPYSRVFGGDYTVPVVTEYVKHPITRDLDVATFFPMARSVRILGTEVPGVSVQYLARTGKSAWGEVDVEGVRRGQAIRSEGDLAPPIPIGLIASRKLGPAPAGGDPRESKVVLFGDSDFIDNSAFRISGNADLFLNIVNYLSENEELISIRAHRGMGDRLFLTASQGRLIFLVCVMLLPLSVIGAGLTMFFRRRNAG